MQNVLDWNDLEIALAIAEAGSLSGAATLLGKKQPTISSRLNHLESRLGTQLFVRSRNGALPTLKGEEVVALAKQMQTAALEIERVAYSANEHEEGVIRFHCSDGLASYWIAPKLEQFFAANPKIRLELDTGSEPPSVNSNDADIIIQFDQVKEMDAVAIPLGWLHYVPFTTAKYLNTYGRPTDVFDALKFRHLKLRNHTHQRKAWASNISPMDELVSYILTTNNSSVYTEAMRGGAGIMFAPSYLANIDPELIYMDYGITTPIQFWLVFNRDVGTLAKNKVFIEWVKTIFSPKTHPFFQKVFIPPDKFSDVEVLRQQDSLPKNIEQAPLPQPHKPPLGSGPITGTG